MFEMQAEETLYWRPGMICLQG